MTEVSSADMATEPEEVATKAPSYFSADESTWGEDITPNKNGSLFKKLLEEGVGSDTPLVGDHVYVHYEGRLLDQTKFDSSKGNPAPFEVDVGLGNRLNVLYNSSVILRIVIRSSDKGVGHRHTDHEERRGMSPHLST